MGTTLRAELEETGYALRRTLVAPVHTETMLHLCEPHLRVTGTPRPGVRRILDREVGLLEALRLTPIPEVIRDIAGPGATLIRSILFDKSPDANWMVPWHQDAVIAVRARAEVDGFGPWSIKDGEPHCRPPRDVLDRIGVLRISLDPCPPASGPLLVIPGSHRLGLVPQSTLDTLVAGGPVMECATDEGGIVVMRPHTIHASAKSTSNARRRVLHLEFTSALLPPPLEWAESVVL